MAETRTYIGGSYEGTFTLPDRTIPFVRDVPVEVTSDEAVILDTDPDWGGTAPVSSPVAAPAPTPPAAGIPPVAPEATPAGSEVPS